MEIRLLGPLEVRDGERTVALPRRQQRALLAALALRSGEVVSTERLVADLWGERAPASATGSLQNTVSALRKALGRDVVLTQAPGYRLALERESVDAHRFERLLADARGAEEAARASLLSEALALWRGPALADLDDEEFARLEGAGWTSCEWPRSKSGSTPTLRSDGTRRSSASSKPWSRHIRSASGCEVS